MFNCIEAFKSKIAEVGLTPPPDIIGDGKIHRFATNNKRGGGGDKAGWYIFHQQPVPTGCFGDWRTGQSGSWSAKSRHDMSVSEVKKYQACLAEAKEQREEEQQKIRRETKAKAQAIYQQANPAGEHPYLINKRVPAYCAKQQDSKLVLPIVNFQGEIVSLQFIDPNGQKRLLTGGAKQGNFIPITKLETPTNLMICEGFATGATLAATYPDWDVMAAIDANNLKPVSVQARKQWPEAQIILFADDDRLTPGNPGQTKAREAAIAAGIQVCSPPWPEGSPEDLTDFNDLTNWIAQHYV